MLLRRRHKVVREIRESAQPAPLVLDDESAAEPDSAGPLRLLTHNGPVMDATKGSTGKARRPTTTKHRDLCGRAAASRSSSPGASPQIAKADGDAPVQAYIAAHAGLEERRRAPSRRAQLCARSPACARRSAGTRPSTALRARPVPQLPYLHHYVKVTFFAGASLNPIRRRRDQGRPLDRHPRGRSGRGTGGTWIRQAAALAGLEKS